VCNVNLRVSLSILKYLFILIKYIYYILMANSNNNFSNKERAMIYSSVYSSNMKKLSWKYNNCIIT
jgi:hypothetical protein